MTLPWFRLYGEMIDDAKLKLLSYEDRWHYVALLCCKAQGLIDGTKPEILDRVIATKLGLTVAEADQVRRRIMEVDLIGGDWQPLGWDRRQFKSDNSTARVQAWRDRKSSPTPPPEETDTETDTEGKRCKQRSRNVSTTLPEKLDAEAWAKWIEYRRTRRYKPPTVQQASHLADFPAEVQVAAVEMSIRNGWQGLFPEKQRPSKDADAQRKIQEWINAGE